MFDVGFWELALISVVALIIIGPERLPDAARVAGLWIGKGRRMLREVKADINRELREQNVADLGALKQDIQSAGEQIKGATEQIHESVDANGIGDSLRDSFKEASPLSGESQAEAERENIPDAGKTDATPARETTPTPAVAGNGNGNTTATATDNTTTATNYYIYENRQSGQSHRAVLHAGACGHCRQGRGRTSGYRPKNIQWHGPFSTLADARREQGGMPVVVRKECRCVSRASATSGGA